MPTVAASILEDIELIVNRALAGDERAMMQIVDRYRQRVYALCYRMMGQREDAEDVAQEAFIRVLRHLSSWDPGRGFEPWLLTIAANRCRTQIAKRKSREPTQTLPFAPADDRWEEEAAAHQLREEVQLALTEIPENHGRAFVLFHQKQLSYATIAAQLGVPEGTVKTWVHRARRELARRLAARHVVEQHHAM